MTMLPFILGYILGITVTLAGLFGYNNSNPIKEIKLINVYRKNLLWLVKHSIESGSISKARGAELLDVSLIDMDEVISEIDI